MTNPPMYPEPRSQATPESLSIDSMPTAQQPAVTPSVGPQKPRMSSTPIPPARLIASVPPAPPSPQARSVQPWSWEDPEFVRFAESMAGMAILGQKQMRRSYLERMILMFAIGLVIGGSLVGYAAVAGLLPVNALQSARKSTPTVTTPTPLSSIVYVVLEVKEETLSAVDSNNHTVLIHTSATTTFQRDGVAASLNEVTAGMRITIRGKVAQDGTISADRIAITDPVISGQIVVVKDNLLGITTKGQTTYVVLNAQTKILDAKTGQTVDPNNVFSGYTIRVYGTLRASGLFDALLILIQE